MVPKSSVTPALVVFGSQETTQSQEAREKLRACLLLTSGLESAVQAIERLPELGRDLIESIPEFRSSIGHAGLECLLSWLGGEEPEHPEGLLSNTFRTTLTVIGHIVLYFKYLKTSGVYQPHQRTLERCDAGGIQGFCTGLIAAVTVACSYTEEDLAENSAWAIQLAFCIGVLVDASSKESNTGNGYASFVARGTSIDFHTVLQQHMKSYADSYISVTEDMDQVTVTDILETSNLLAQELMADGIHTKDTGLRGRFHSALNHALYLKLQDFFSRRDSFRLTPRAPPVALVRSNSDAQPLMESDICSQVLKSVIIDPCNWFLVIKAAVAALPNIAKIPVLSIGSSIKLPRSLTKGLDLDIRSLNALSLMQRMADTNKQPAQGYNSPSYEPQWYKEDMVAVIGMGFKFPKANSAEELWDLLLRGVSVVGKVPKSRFDTKSLSRASRTKVPFLGCFLDDIASFDNRFFNKSSREAESMDPQQRLLLEVAYQALHSASYFKSMTGKRPQNVGCYIGTGSHDYNDNVACHAPNAFSALGTLKSFQAGKISHFFNFTGPSMTCDTACSSSAVAIDLACKAILSGNCSMALAGGVSMFTTPYLYENLSASGFLSPTGQCKPFDAAADGYCRGEGVGLVVLKRLDQALADRNHIRGVIASSWVNQNSNEAPITAPNSNSQSEAFNKSISTAKIDASTVTYVEAHGTGTKVGDPIEYSSIRNFFMKKDRLSPLYLGSLKGNVGHLEGASGVGSLIKVLLMMEHQIISPQASFEELNSNINADPNIIIPTSPVKWEAPHRRATINNYGASGSNATILVYEAPSKTSHVDVENRLTQYPVFLSAHSRSSLQAYCKALSKISSKYQEHHLPKFIFNLSEQQNHKLGCVVTGLVNSFSSLRTLLSDAAMNDKVITERSPKQKPVILVFAGQNRGTISIDKSFYESFGVLRSHIIACDTILKTLGITTLIPHLFDPPADDFLMYQILLFSIQYASAKSWIDSGLVVSRVIGHSLGQLTALCISGVLSLSDALRLVVRRAQLVYSHWGKERGSMLAVEVDLPTLKNLIPLAAPGEDPNEDQLEIACYNGPFSLVIGGSVAKISQLQEKLGTQVKHKLLPVSHAYHSFMTKPILHDLEKLAGELVYNEPTIPIETCSNQQSWGAFGKTQIVEHARLPVYFDDAVKRIEGDHGPCIWLEAGSQSSITSLLRRCLESPSEHSMQSLALDTHTVVEKLAQTTTNLWQLGIAVQFWKFHLNETSLNSHINLPPYQFDKKHHWLEWKSQQPLPVQQPPPSNVKITTSLLTLTKDSESGKQTVQFLVNTKHADFQMYVEGHSILQSPLCPASLYVELVAQAIQHISGRDMCWLRELGITSPLTLVDNSTVMLHLSSLLNDKESWSFELLSRSNEASRAITHASGEAGIMKAKSQLADEFSTYERLIDLERFECLSSNPKSHVIQGPLIYSLFSRVTIYLNYYQGVRKIVSCENSVYAQVEIPPTETTQFDKTITHPLTFDNFLQVAGLQVNCIAECDPDHVYVCSHIGSILFLNTANLQSNGGSYIVCSTGTPKNNKMSTRDIFVFDTRSKSLQIIIRRAQFFQVPIASMVSILQKVSGSVSGPAQPRFPLRGEDTSTGTSFPSTKETISTGINQNTTELTDVKSIMKSIIEELQEIPADQIEDESTLSDLGIDSIMSLEIISKIKSNLNVNIASDDFSRFSTFNQFSCYLMEMSNISSVPSPATTRTSTTITSSSDASNTSLENEDDRILALLTEMLDVAHPIPHDTAISSLPIDSLMSMELAAETKKRFGQSIDIAELDPSLTVDGLQSLITSGFKPRKGPQEHREGELQSAEKLSPASRPQAARRHEATPARLFHTLQGKFASFSERSGFSGFYERVLVAQNTLVVEYIIGACEQLGTPWSEMTAGTPFEVKGYLPKFENLVTQLKKHLQAECLIAIDGGALVRTGKTIHRTPAQVQLEALIKAHPHHKIEHQLLGIVGRQLAGILKGITNPLELLFQNSASRTLLEQVYAHAPMYEAMNETLGDFISRISAADPSRTLRILEVGAGTGGTTRYVLKHLRSQNTEFEYVFTDVSSFLIQGAKKVLGTDNIRYMVLDIEKEPPPGLLGQFDLVISTNCVHATANIESSCSNIIQLLEIDGALLLIELTRNLPWLDIVFGVLDGWWLFNDGRTHALAHEHVWEQTLLRAGFDSVDWTDGPREEDKLLRIVAGFRGRPFHATKRSEKDKLQVSPKKLDVQTIEWKKEDGMQFLADVYLPRYREIPGKRPIALMIHGGGHCMLSRKDVRLYQVQTLIDYGFLPISIDYRLCPEVNICDGPMTDAADALSWARSDALQSAFKNSTINPDNERIVVVGWSTGGTLALQTSWTAGWRGVRPPSAVLAFYCPTDYEDDVWTRPNFPMGSGKLSKLPFDLLDGVQDKPILSYNPSNARDGWMNFEDSRSRILLHMVWRGQTLPVILDGLCSRSASSPNDESMLDLPQPAKERVAAISPYSHVAREDSDYGTPTFLIHGTNDDLIPWEQSQRFIDMLKNKGVRADGRILDGGKHLFDLVWNSLSDGAREAIHAGYKFLLEAV